MKIDDFLSKLQGVREDGKGGWLACCPAHPDKNPSMHVNVGEGGKILVKCFAGCTVDEIVAALGLKLSDLMPDDGKRVKRGKRGKKAAAEPPSAAVLPRFAAPKSPRDYGKLQDRYDYQDAEGKVVYRVERRVRADGQKTFIQKHPDAKAKGGWGFGVSKAGVEYVPFRVPRLLAAGKAGKSVVICEGEKDVCNIERMLGVVATCNARGAGKWLSGWGEYFKGVPKILIIADKDPVEKLDEKTGEMKPFAVGQRHACDVEAKLRADGYEGVIRKVVLPDVERSYVKDGLKMVEMIPVKDFTDWAEAVVVAGGKVSRDVFAEALKRAGNWPEAWEFGRSDAADLQRAQKSARNSASVGRENGSVQSEAREEAEGENGGEAMGECGRYGRLSPRAPLEKARLYEVDFQINASHIGRFEIGLESFRFEGWVKSESEEDFGQYRKIRDYPEQKGKLDQFVGMALGSVFSFMAGRVKLAGPQISDLTCKVVMAWLRARGKFFADAGNPNYETSMFFDETQGVLYNLHSAEFMSFLAGHANVNREVKTYKMLMSLIDDLAMDAAETPRVTPAKQWARAEDGRIYLSNGDSRMYRVAPGRVDDVQNGTDGILFLRGETFEPWTYEVGSGLDPFDDAIVFRTAAWTDSNSRMNIRLWYLNLFACHKNKPILLVEGPAGSGKTTIARQIKALLSPRTHGQSDTNVNQVSAQDKGADDFWVTIDNGRLEIFDNMDSKIKWANDNLQTAATNGSHKVRELYKTKQVAQLNANAYIIITSNNPIFATDGGGLPDRIIQGHIGAGRKESLDNELTEDIKRKRNRYLSWTVDVLAAALADEKPVQDSINRRHPNYGIFSMRCARVLKLETEAVRAMNAAEIDKSVLPLINEPVAKEIYITLMAQESKGSMRFTSSDMSSAIIARFGDDESDENTKKIYGPRRIGKAMSKFKREFAVIFRSKPERILDGRTVYEFEGLTPQGETLVSDSSGLDSGKVGNISLFGESPIREESADGFSKNNELNPLDPLHAHAQAHDDPSLSQEEDIDGEYGFDL